jgi:hypothetical protein
LAPFFMFISFSGATTLRAETITVVIYSRTASTSLRS